MGVGTPRCRDSCLLTRAGTPFPAAPDDAVGVSKVARQSGLSRESLYKALSEGGNPSLDTILRVARAVGVRFRTSAA